MKLIKYAFVIFYLFSFQASAANAPSLKPKYRSVELKEFTSVQIDVLPHSGVQLIFPFVLDEPSLKPALKITYAGSDGFEVPASSDKAKVSGKNTVTIVGNAPSSQGGNSVFLSTLFINVGGYNVTVSMRTQYDVRKVDTGIVFNLSNSERKQLISSAVDKYKEQIDKEYEKKLSKLDSMARQEALKFVGELVTNDPDYKSFKIESDFSIGDSRFVFYADELVVYPSFSTVVFEVENKSTVDVRLDSISLSVIDENDNPRSISGLFDCPKVFSSDSVSKCTFSSTSPALLDSQKYDLTVSTEIGSEVVSW